MFKDKLCDKQVLEDTLMFHIGNQEFINLVFLGISLIRKKEREGKVATNPIEQSFMGTIKTIYHLPIDTWFTQTFLPFFNPRKGKPPKPSLPKDVKNAWKSR